MSDLPRQLTIRSAAIALDGGTVRLTAVDEAGKDRAVTLVQRANPARRSGDEVPGRLYFDDQLVPLRSPAETAVLSLLKSAPVADDLAQAFTTRVVEFVESDEYLLFADRVEQATDETPYDIWLVWDDSTLSRAVVQTKQALGLGLKEARVHVQQGRPLAKGLRASEVIDWARRLREASLGVRVEPAFRWRLP